MTEAEAWALAREIELYPSVEACEVVPGLSLGPDLIPAPDGTWWVCVGFVEGAAFTTPILIGSRFEYQAIRADL